MIIHPIIGPIHKYVNYNACFIIQALNCVFEAVTSTGGNVLYVASLQPHLSHPVSQQTCYSSEKQEKSCVIKIFNQGEMF